MRLIIVVAVLAQLGCYTAPIPEIPEYSLADQLPEGVEVVESFSIKGMDAFHLVKARYGEEAHISQICEEFQLLPYQGNTLNRLGFAGAVDAEENIAWFPLQSSTRIFQYSSVNKDGSFKDSGDKRRYQNMLWINDEDKALILQRSGF